MNDHSFGRLCLRDPIPEIFDAARYLDAAVSAFIWRAVTHWQTN